MVSLSTLDGYLAVGKIIADEPLRPAILEQIRIAASLTKELKGHYFEFLDAQGLFPF
jgi:hypothetical protein